MIECENRPKCAHPVRGSGTPRGRKIRENFRSSIEWPERRQKFPKTRRNPSKLVGPPHSMIECRKSPNVHGAPWGLVGAARVLKCAQVMGVYRVLRAAPKFPQNSPKNPAGASGIAYTGDDRVPKIAEVHGGLVGSRRGVGGRTGVPTRAVA